VAVVLTKRGPPIHIASRFPRRPKVLGALVNFHLGGLLAVSKVWGSINELSRKSVMKCLEDGHKFGRYSWDPTPPGAGTL
jgi:hypothetical protein